jgi:hypothetical protein
MRVLVKREAGKSKNPERFRIQGFFELPQQFRTLAEASKILMA